MLHEMCKRSSYRFMLPSALAAFSNLIFHSEFYDRSGSRVGHSVARAGRGTKLSQFKHHSTPEQSYVHNVELQLSRCHSAGQMGGLIEDNLEEVRALIRKLFSVTSMKPIDRVSHLD